MAKKRHRININVPHQVSFSHHFLAYLKISTIAHEKSSYEILYYYINQWLILQSREKNNKNICDGALQFL